MLFTDGENNVINNPVAYGLNIGAATKDGLDPGPVLIILICNLLVGFLAKYRRRRFLVWFLLSCLISPLISVIILFVKKKGLTADDLEVMGAEYLIKFNAAPENCKYGAAIDLYTKITNNKVLYKSDFRDAENALSLPKSTSKDWT